jgi:site-specific recombinase XerD
MKLSDAVDLYIQRKRNAGMRFDSPAYVLRSFLRHCGEIDLHHITVQQVVAFLEGSGASPKTWNGKRGTLRAFFDCWAARGRLKSSPLPPSAPKAPQSFLPYIYSRSELHSLLDGVPRCQRSSKCVMSAATFQTLLLFLYATGMRLGEALRLRLADLDETLALVTIRDTKFYKSRLVPLGPDIAKVIWQYLHLPGRRNQDYRPLFQTKSGDALRVGRIVASFVRLRKIACIERHDDSYFQPRLHDLRHTFAVHRLTEWYKQGADLQRLLPALSTYLGHVDLQATQRYLTMTPELLREANHRFERYACGGADEE